MPGNNNPSDAFDMTIFDSTNKVLYSWNQQNYTYSYTNNGVPFKNSTGLFSGPIIQMSTSATTRFVQVIPGSYVNGNVTSYDFTITSTNYLWEGYYLTIKFPPFMYFSTNSTCIGASKNLRAI